MFAQLFNNPILYSLSLTLLHFLWQGLLVALILKSVLFIIDTNHSKLRYIMATFAMLINAMFAIVTFTTIYPHAGIGSNSSIGPIPLTNLVNELTQQSTLLNYQELLPSVLAYSLPYLSLLWLATITMLASKLLIEVCNVNNLPIGSSVPPPYALLVRFEALAKQIKLPKTPALLISLKAEVPMAIGWLKPVVLLPARMVTGLDSAQLEMLILHELAHIRRHDYLVNFLQTIIELLLFFHPSVHWIGKQMRNEREYCSDDIAVQHCGNAIAYAHTLTDTASLCAKGHVHTIPAMAMAASGGDLKARVMRLVDHHCAPNNNTGKWLASISLFLALILLCINQFLTMPVAQQLKNQFPWQESSSLSHNFFPATPMNIDGSDINNKKVALSNDSIAQQLLNHESLAKSRSETKVINIQIAVNLPKKNKKRLTTDIVEPIIVKPIIIENNYFLADASQKSTASITQLTDFLSENKTHLLEQVFSVEEQSTKFKLSIFTNKPPPNNLAGEEIPKSISSQVKTIPLPVVIDSVQSVRSKQPTQISTAQVIYGNTKRVNKSKSVDINKILTHNNGTYTKMLYRQEISKLAVQSSLYESSGSFSSRKSLDMQPSTQRLTTSIVSNEAKVLNSINPVYPSLAKRRGIEMEVKVDFTIDRHGRVKDIYFTPQSKIVYFKSVIRSAIRKWRFSPATKNNRNVESKMSKIFSFSLHK
jgi:bla regulator protein BlaR1